MDFKKTVREGYNAIADRYLATRTRDSEDVRLLDEFMEKLPANANVLDAGCGAEDLVDDIDEDYLGTRMYWSHYDEETYLKMLNECGFSIIWSRRVADATCEGAGHLSVLVQK